MNTPQGLEVQDADQAKKDQLTNALEQIDIAARRLPTEEEQGAINKMAGAAGAFVLEVVTHIPDGKEREVAINNTISAMLWARQGIVRGRIEMVAMP